MPIQIHGTAKSTCTGRVMTTLLELGVDDYEIVEVDLKAGQHKSPSFLALQPFGQVPVLVDGDLTLFESRAIIRTLAHKFQGQGTPLYGTTPKDKALVETWLEVESQNYNPHVSVAVYALVFAPMFGMPPQEEQAAAALEKLEKVLDVYEQHLTSSKYLAGDFFSLADLSHLTYTQMLLRVRPNTFDSRPHVKAWWNSISSRPSFQKYLQIAFSA